MHMADALLSPAVGGTMWAASAVMVGYSANELRKKQDDTIIALMGVMGAFVFAAEMLNFAIPSTGSSGHIGGGLLLAIVLGPHAACLTLSAVLAVQALLFADGGLLALGCNIFNLAFFPCFLAYPLIYRPLVSGSTERVRIFTVTLLAAVVGLQAGAFSVVVETRASGITALPFGHFLLLMQPIHLAIGIIEGLATAAVIVFLGRNRPEILHTGPSVSRPAVAGIIIAALLMAGVASWFASPHPDGLEWAMERTAGTAELSPPESELHAQLSAIQRTTALLPDYGLPEISAESASNAKEPWPAVDAGTSLAGVTGGLLLFVIAVAIALVRRPREARCAIHDPPEHRA